MILHALALVEQEQIAQGILKVFGASSFEDCCAKYDAARPSERAVFDAAVGRVVEDAGDAFWQGVSDHDVPIATPPDRRRTR